jgi:hypothetical protein
MQCHTFVEFLFSFADVLFATKRTFNAINDIGTLAIECSLDWQNITCACTCELFGCLHVSARKAAFVIARFAPRAAYVSILSVHKDIAKITISTINHARGRGKYFT